MERKSTLYLCLTLLAWSCGQSITNTSPVSRHYNVYIQGHSAGQYEVEWIDATNCKFSYFYNDRGRGPELTGDLSLNPDGFISDLSISGLNYLKDSTQESFHMGPEWAFWKGTEEKDSVANPGDKMYTPANSVLTAQEVCIRKMLQTPDQEVAILPGGTARITAIKPVRLRDSLDLQLIEYTGFGFSSEYAWLDNDQRLFALVSSWLTFIPASYHSWAEEMYEQQLELERAYFARLADSLTETPDSTLVLKNVNLFDANKGEVLTGRSVVIAGNQIVSILDGNQPIPAGSQVIDGQGKSLLPGLFDNHCHVQRIDGLLHLAAGVTSVRDMANSPELLEIRDEFDANQIPGPRIVTMCGFIDQKGPFAGPGLTITSVPEGLEAIDNYHQKGYQQIKLYSSIDPAWVKPLAAHAHQLGMRVSGHIPAHMLAAQAIRDGYNEIQHINMIALNFLSDTIDTRTPLRFSSVAENTYQLDLDGKPFMDFIRLLQQQHIAVDPTVGIFENMFTTRPGQVNPLVRTVYDRFPAQIQREFIGGGLPIPDGKAAIYQASFDKLLAIIHALYLNGITILPGTDELPGFALHRELEHYVAAGISPIAVLQVATLGSAKHAGREADLGTIEPGKLADMILVDGDPTQDIRDIRHTVLTIKDGKLFHPDQLYKAIGVLPESALTHTPDSH